MKTSVTHEVTRLLAEWRNGAERAEAVLRTEPLSMFALGQIRLPALHGTALLDPDRRPDGSA
jgi:hypothetical protein